jgi:nitrogen fixation NifU-like protein
MTGGSPVDKPALYDDLIMDHIKNARNYREIDNADYTEIGSNPLCGDELTVFVSLDDKGRLDDVSYQCTCCGITMASASLMTEHVKGRSVDEVAAMARAFRAEPNATNGVTPAGDARDGVVQTVLEIARQYPARQRCAALPWTALGSLLERLPTA